MNLSKKQLFLWSNLAQGFAWMVIFIVAYVLIKDNIQLQPDNVIVKYGHKPLLIFSIYTLSEIIIGIFPPELFMMWSLKFAEHRNYIVDLTMLAAISYAAGTLTYFFGRYFNGTVIYRYLRKRFLKKYEKLFNQYGGFLLFVAAITPVPFSTICMLLGSANYSVSKFLSISLFRLARFPVYGYLVWQASLL